VVAGAVEPVAVYAGAAYEVALLEVGEDSEEDLGGCLAEGGHSGRDIQRASSVRRSVLGVVCPFAETGGMFGQMTAGNESGS